MHCVPADADKDGRIIK